MTNQENYYRQLGLRERILNLPLTMAAVLTLLWRDDELSVPFKDTNPK